MLQRVQIAVVVGGDLGESGLVVAHLQLRQPQRLADRIDLIDEVQRLEHVVQVGGARLVADMQVLRVLVVLQRVHGLVGAAVLEEAERTLGELLGGRVGRGLLRVSVRLGGRLRIVRRVLRGFGCLGGLRLVGGRLRGVVGRLLRVVHGLLQLREVTGLRLKIGDLLVGRILRALGRILTSLRVRDRLPVLLGLGLRVRDRLLRVLDGLLRVGHVLLGVRDVLRGLGLLGGILRVLGVLLRLVEVGGSLVGGLLLVGRLLVGLAGGGLSVLLGLVGLVLVGLRAVQVLAGLVELVLRVLGGLLGLGQRVRGGLYGRLGGLGGLVESVLRFECWLVGQCGGRRGDEHAGCDGDCRERCFLLVQKDLPFPIEFCVDFHSISHHDILAIHLSSK